MIITCPDCATRYTVNPDVFPLTGRTVKCARCETTWYALPKQEPEEPEMPDEEPAAGEDAQATPDDAPPDDWDAFAAASMETDEPETVGDAGPQTVAGEEDLDWTDSDDGGADAGASGGELVVARPDAADAADEEVAAEEDTQDIVDEDAFDVEGVSGAAQQPEAAVIVDDDPQDAGETAALRSVNSIEMASRARAAAKRFMGKSRGGRERSLGERIKAVAVGGMAAALVAGFVYREDVVRMAPSLAGLYASIGYEVNLRGLAFEDVRPSQATENGIPVLRVEGAIRNVTGDEIAVPPVRLSLNAAGGQEIYYWTIQPDAAALKPGEAISFRSVLSAPPRAAAAVAVRFVEPDRMRVGMTN